MRETANAASNTPKTSMLISTRRSADFWLLQASHSVESNAPTPVAAERKPKPVAPTCSTSVAKKGENDVEVGSYQRTSTSEQNKRSQSFMKN